MPIHSEKIAYLEKKIAGMTQYLLLKVEEKDWHGVADAAMDIRELEAKLGVYRNLDVQG